MIKSIIQNELRLTIFNRKTWFCLAAIHAILAVIFNWLLINFLKLKTTLDTVRYGVTEEVIHPYYAWFALIVLAFIPMLTTQSICAERSRNTIVNYYMAPISSLQVILGKFLALNLTLLLIMLSISILPFAITLSGALDWGQIFASILGVYLMLSAALAVGLVFSSFMQNVARSNVVIFSALIMFILLEWAAQFSGKQAIFLQTFGLLNPLKNFLSGIISVQHVAYYLLIISSCLILGDRLFAHGKTNA